MAQVNAKSGITLISLVVTIIVLLILAGVSINAVFSDNGIIKKAQEAQDKVNNAIQNDMDEINELTNLLDSYMNGTGSNGESTGGDNETEDGYNGTNTLPATPDTIPYFPDSTFAQVANTSLSEGLVIEDATGNQYVWVEVPTSLYSNTEYNTETKTEDQKPTSSTDYDKIEYCLHKYTSYYRNETDYTDTYYSDETTGLAETQYNEFKKKMLKSVYKNGGFWVARYEAGIETNRSASGTPTVAPLSKANVYAYNYVTCSQAQTLANMLTTADYTSSLMFGVQWDLVLKFIETKSVENGIELATIQSELTSDSTNWGNYYNNLWTISATSAKYSTDLGATYMSAPYTKENSEAVLLTTGASNVFRKINISDLAANVWEWTLECSDLSGYRCTARGGNIWRRK